MNNFNMRNTLHVKFLLFVGVYCLCVQLISGHNTSDTHTADGLPVNTFGPGNYFFQGPPGKDGRDGRDGRDGIGAPGPKGDSGCIRREQTTGTPRLQENPAHVGAMSPEGSAGQMGVPGKMGPPGPRGHPGQDGEQGSTGPQGPPGVDAPDPGSVGTVFTRWGRSICPNTSELVYDGTAGGTFYDEHGGGANYLCLPKTPEYDVFQAGRGSYGYRAYMYSAEYEIVDFPLLSSKQDHDVPCAVCRANNRGSTLMVPAMLNCPTGWTNEYHGFLMTEGVYNSGTRQRKEFICVDRFFEVIPGGGGNQNGALLTLVESRCDRGHLPCPPYEDGKELTCVVCTK